TRAQFRLHPPCQLGRHPPPHADPSRHHRGDPLIERGTSMSAPGKFPFRPALYGIVILYLVGDLFLVGGPIRRQIDLTNPDSPAFLAAAKERGVVARVAGQPITRSQIDRALAERLWLDGKSTTDLSPEELTAARDAA